MTHNEFVRLIERRKVSILNAMVRAALPPGALFAVVVGLESSDDPAEIPVAAVISNAEPAELHALMSRQVQ